MLFCICFILSISHCQVKNGLKDTGLLHVTVATSTLPEIQRIKTISFSPIQGEKGFNQLHLNAMYDLCSNRYLDALLQPGRKENEARAAGQMVKRFAYSEKPIFIADRGYESYNVFAHIERKGMNYLIRVKDRDSNGILGAILFPETDIFDVDVHKRLTRKQTNEVKAHPEKDHFLPRNSPFDFLDLHTNLFYDMNFRVVRFKLSEDSYEYIITNLDRETFPPEKIKELYHMRWALKTLFVISSIPLACLIFTQKRWSSLSRKSMQDWFCTTSVRPLPLTLLLRINLANIRIS